MPSPLGPLFDLERWLDVPSSHGLWSLFETVEGTTITDRIGNGGLFSGEAGLLGVHGSSWTQVSYRLDGLDITDPERTGTPLLLPDLGAFRTLDVATGLMRAEDGGPGAVVQLVPRRPGDAWHGAIGADVIPAGWQSSPPIGGPPAIARYASFASGRFRLDGPLVKDRLGLLLSGAVTHMERLEGDDPARLVGREASLLGNLSWKASPSDDVRFLGAVQGTLHPYGGRARYAAMDSRESNDSLILQSSWSRHGSVPWALSAGYARGDSDPDLAGRVPGDTVERLRDGPVPLLFPGASRRSRTALAVGVSPAARAFAGGSHASRLGVSTTWTGSSNRPVGTSGFTPETVNGLPARVWEYGWAGPESQWRAFDFSAYGADTITQGPASLELGLRFESTSGSAQGGSGEIHWRGLSPRLSARIHLTRSGALSFLGGYARYRHRLPLGFLAYGDPTALQGSVYRWVDRNGDAAFEADERGAAIARVGPGGSFASIDPRLRAPSTQEVVAGLELRLGHAWALHVLGVHRREHDLVGVVNEGVPLSAYAVRYLPDPGGNIIGAEDDQLLPVYDRSPASFGQDRYFLTNTADNTLHEGVEIEVRGSIGERWLILLGATTSRSVGAASNVGYREFENDQGLIGDGLANPNAATFTRGRLFFDRAYTLKLSGAYRAPGDVRVGVAARYQDGQPFARLVVVPSLHQGPEAVRGIPNGRSRFTFTMTVDARVEKGFGLGRARLAAVLEAFNLLGDAREVEEDVVTDPAYRQVTAVQPPRALRLGVRLDF